LPDAMEGPTPVSALIHAATMVTAGVFLIVRMAPLYEVAPLARDIVCLVGAFTALFAATIAVTQNDIKRIIAYSTCSQLGYMFIAAGVSAYGAAMFHLITHAFFKALLFLGAGAVIHAMSDEQDIRRMGGIRSMIPITYTMMWIGSLALVGVPFFSGYYSKEAILQAAYSYGTGVGQIAFIVGIVVIIFTAFYSWRLLILTFEGKPRADDRVMAHVHEAPASMRFALYILAGGAAISGYLGHELFLDPDFWEKTLPPLRSSIELPAWVLILPLLCAFLGISLAYLFYVWKPTLPSILATRFARLYSGSLNKWFVDELYQKIVVNPALGLGRFFSQTGDKQIIDRWGPDGIAAASLGLAHLAGRLQTGYVYHYAFAMLIGIVALISWILIMQG
jgi:NADH-quinone oxidoreductase subunit L